MAQNKHVNGIASHHIANDDTAINHVETIPLDLDDPHKAALEENPDTPEIPPLSSILAIIFLALSFVCPISCGFTLVTGILFTIKTDLHDTEGKITWLVGGLSIASSVSFSIAGSLSDTFGRRWTIIVGQLLSIVGSIVAATSHNVEQLIIGSTLLGFAAGIIFVTYAGISELLPNKWRGAGLALTEAAITVPWVIAGVLIANLLVLHTSLGWRWCYYMGVIFGGASFLGTLIFYHPPPRPQFDFDKSRWQQFKSIDFVGLILYTAGLTTFLIGITWAGTPAHPWRSTSVIAPIILGLCTLIACFVYDFTIPKSPLFPREVFSQVRDFTLLLGVVFVAGVVYFSMTALLPQGSLYMFSNEPIEIGLIALPNGFIQFFCGAILPALIGRFKQMKMQILIALTIQTAFTAALAAAIPHNKAAWMALQAFAIGPFAFVTLACYVIAGLNIPLRHLGLVSGLIGTFRSMGGSIGNAIMNTILQSIVNRDLGPAITAVALANGVSPSQLELVIIATTQTAVGVPGAFEQLPAISSDTQAALIEAFRGVYAHGFRIVFYTTIPFGVLAIILAALSRDSSMYLTNHTAVRMNGQSGRDIPQIHEQQDKAAKTEHSQSV